MYKPLPCSQTPPSPQKQGDPPPAAAAAAAYFLLSDTSFSDIGVRSRLLRPVATGEEHQPGIACGKCLRHGDCVPHVAVDDLHGVRQLHLGDVTHEGENPWCAGPLARAEALCSKCNTPCARAHTQSIIQSKMYTGARGTQPGPGTCHLPLSPRRIESPSMTHGSAGRSVLLREQGAVRRVLTHLDGSTNLFQQHSEP